MASFFTAIEAKPWKLEGFFPHHDGIGAQEMIVILEQEILSFEALKSNLDPMMDSDILVSMIQQFELITTYIKKLEGYAELWLAENAQDQAAHAFDARIRHCSTDVMNRTLFFINWWKKLDDSNAARLMKRASPYTYWLSKLRALTPYTRSDSEEHILNLKNMTGSATLITLYQSITSRYRFTLEVNGQKIEISGSNLAEYVMNPDPIIRWDACEEVFRVFSQDKSIIGNIYLALTRNWYIEQVDIRGFPSPISARNLSNDIPDSIVETLLSICQQNSGIFYRYFRVKSRWLNISPLKPTDLFAPIGLKRRYELPDALEHIFSAINTFDPQVANMLKSIFDAGHVDMESRMGKRRGAWCFTQTPDVLPWISVAYTGDINDVIGLAHECGHAIHALLSSRQRMLNYHVSIPLAETASLFIEMLVVDHLIDQETDSSIQQSIRFRQLDDAYLSIQRQIYLTLFEQDVYSLVKQGGTIDEVASLYMNRLRGDFGSDIEVSTNAQWEWLLLSALYYDPFYAYSYAFGHLLALSLYQRYKVEGISFVPHILHILEAGGSASPADILKEVGIDIADPLFWQAGFDMIQSMVETLESIPTPV